MYVRYNNGVRIEWDPEHKAEAKKAMENAGVDLDSNGPVEVDDGTARQIRSEYTELTKVDEQ